MPAYPMMGHAGRHPRSERVNRRYVHEGFATYGMPYSEGGCQQCGYDSCFPPVCGKSTVDPCSSGDTTGCIRQSLCDCCSERYKCRSTCNMYPHYPYFPAFHGYYYFRPYNYSHVPVQKDIALAFGEDPTAPYAGALFDRLYAELMVEAYEEPGIGAETLNPTPRQMAPPLPDLQEVLESR